MEEGDQNKLTYSVKTLERTTIVLTKKCDALEQQLLKEKGMHSEYQKRLLALEERCAQLEDETLIRKDDNSDSSISSDRSGTDNNEENGGQ